MFFPESRVPEPRYNSIALHAQKGRPMNSAWRPTTLIHAPRLAARLDVNLVLASETFQVTGSFKFRAAYHLASNIPNPLVIAASSGNFGQALAHACTLTGKASIVVMP